MGLEHISRSFNTAYVNDYPPTTPKVRRRSRPRSKREPCGERHLEEACLGRPSNFVSGRRAHSHEHCPPSFHEESRQLLFQLRRHPSEHPEVLHKPASSSPEKAVGIKRMHAGGIRVGANTLGPSGEVDTGSAPVSSLQSPITDAGRSTPQSCIVLFASTRTSTMQRSTVIGCYAMLRSSKLPYLAMSG